MKFDAKQVDFIVELVNSYAPFPVRKERLIQDHGIETYLSEKDEAFRDVFPYMDKYVDKDGGSVNAIYNPFGEYDKALAVMNYLDSCKSEYYFFDKPLGNYYITLDYTQGSLIVDIIKEEDFNVKYTKAVAKIV